MPSTIFDLIVGAISGGACGAVLGIVLPIALFYIWGPDDPTGFGVVLPLQFVAVLFLGAIGAVIGVLVAADFFKQDD